MTVYQARIIDSDLLNKIRKAGIIFYSYSVVAQNLYQAKKIGSDLLNVIRKVGIIFYSYLVVARNLYTSRKITVKKV